MGNGIVRFVMNRVKRPFRDFNLESRAHKEISKDKPTIAPRHKAEELDYEQLLQDYPEVYKESLRKNEELDKNLREVYVKSFDPDIPKSKANPQRPLPLDRHQVENFEYGIKMPDKVPIGKATLKQILQFLTDHQQNPKIHTIQKISQDYSIPEEKISNIIKYFKLYEVYIPTNRKIKAPFVGPTIPRVELIERPKPQLKSGEELNKDKS